MAQATARRGFFLASSTVFKRGLIGCVILMGVTAASVVHPTLGDPTDRSETGLYSRLSLELESRLQTREPMAEAVVALGPGGRDIRLAGEFGEGTAERLARLLKTHGHVERIHLTSEGGLVDEGEAVGALIERYGLTTYVPDYCVSACTLAFVRGRQRIIVAHTRLGFHAPYEEGLFGEEFQADSTSERAAYLAAGVEAEFVDVALKVRSDDLWIPEPDRLLKARVATEIVDLYRFPDSTLDDGADLAHARAAVLRNFPLLRDAVPTAGAGASDVVDEIADLYLDAYRSGISEGEAVAGLKRVAATTIARLMINGDDDTLIALGRYLTKAMKRAGEAQTCVAIGEAGDLVQARAVLHRSENDEASKLVAAAASRSNGFGPKLATVNFSEQPAARQNALVRDCETMLRRYQLALELPRLDAAASLRRLMSPLADAQPSLEASRRP